MFSIIIASAAVATTTAASSSECNYKGVSSKRRRQPPRPRPLRANNYLLAYLFMVLLIIEQRRKKAKKKLCPLPQLSSPFFLCLPSATLGHFQRETSTECCVPKNSSSSSRGARAVHTNRFTSDRHHLRFNLLCSPAN